MKFLSYLGQFVLAILVCVLASGPYSQQLGITSPDWIAISVWLCAWFLEPKMTYRWAVILGLVLDIISFRYIGVWVFALLLLSYVVLQVHKRFLQVSSLFQAMMVLLFCTVFCRLIVLILNQSFLVLNQELFRLLATIIWGVIIYYGVAFRWRLFARWTGRRI